jgi:hypothetical protein
MSETLLGRTTRTVTFTDQGNTIRMVRKPASTFVWAKDQGDGTLRIRVPQTLLTQTVPLSAVEPV